jgi:OmpA-OmpF porin, OOP family
MKRKLSILLVLLAGFIAPSFAQEEADGGKDHPVFPRMPNYYIYEYEEKEFDFFDMPIDSKNEEKVQRIEGHKTFIRYMLKEGSKEAGGVQISRNYGNAITKIGGTVVATQSDYKTTYKVNRNGKEVWAYLSPTSGDYELTIIEREAMKQDISAGELLAALEKEGHVALYINFDTGKDVIKPESKSIIEQVTKMLKDNPKLQVIIEGHTDNTGDKDGNQLLSEMRSASVKSALVENGIDQKRLEAVGYGRTKPIAENDTEEGRAKNRRVEIVKKK